MAKPVMYAKDMIYNKDMMVSIEEAVELLAKSNTTIFVKCSCTNGDLISIEVNEILVNGTCFTRVFREGGFAKRVLALFECPWAALSYACSLVE